MVNLLMGSFFNLINSLFKFLFKLSNNLFNILLLRLENGFKNKFFIVKIFLFD